MHARQHRRAVVDHATHQREVRQAGQRVAIADQAEAPEFRVEFAIERSLHGLLGLQPVADQVGDAADPQAMRRGELLRLIREAGREPVERDTRYQRVERAENVFTVLV